MGVLSRQGRLGVQPVAKVGQAGAQQARRSLATQPTNGDEMVEVVLLQPVVVVQQFDNSLLAQYVRRTGSDSAGAAGRRFSASGSVTGDDEDHGQSEDHDHGPAMRRTARRLGQDALSQGLRLHGTFGGPDECVT